MGLVEKLEMGKLSLSHSDKIPWPQKLRREKDLVLTYGTRESLSQGGRHGDKNRKLYGHISIHSEEVESEREGWGKAKTAQVHSQLLSLLSRAPPPKGSIIFPNSSTN